MEFIEGKQNASSDRNSIQEISGIWWL